MTGYGKAEIHFNGKKIHAEIKSLNSKNLDLSARIAPIYREKEMEVRKFIAAQLERGKVDFNLWVEKDQASSFLPINQEAVKDYTMTKRQADALLRKDLRKFCAMFRKFGRDSLLLATLAYNVGPYRLLGSGKIPKSTLIRKLEAGDRNIYREYIAFCNYKGKRHAMLLKRRKAEFALLYIP